MRIFKCKCGQKCAESRPYTKIDLCSACEPMQAAQTAAVESIDNFSAQFVGPALNSLAEAIQQEFLT
mgnify:CR=1 FL=1